MERINKNITELIEKNPSAAKALHFLGIHFYNYTENTLQEVCEARGIQTELVIKKLNEALYQKENTNLEGYPVELIIAYLKHSHYLFIKDRLPYLTQIIEDYPHEESELIQELKFIFPAFRQEFIEHVYEEEDTLFAYILRLKKLLKEDAPSEVLKQILAAQSLKKLEHDHQHHDDEMKSIAELTQQYSVSPSLDLHTRVILEALRNFSRDLKIHAKIENEILFPKAYEIEQQVQKKLETVTA